MLTPIAIDKVAVDNVVRNEDMDYIPKVKEWYDAEIKFEALSSMSESRSDIDYSCFENELNKLEMIGGPLFKGKELSSDAPAEVYFSYFFLFALHFISHARLNPYLKKRKMFIYPFMEFKERINYLNDSGLFDKFLETFKARYLQDYSVPRLKCDPSEVDKVHEKFVNLFTEIAKHDLKSQGWDRLGEAVVFYHNEEE